MKKLVLVAALATLSACSGASEADAPADTTQAMVEDMAATTAADGGPSTGTFSITNAAGEVSTEVLADDGTYTSTNAAGEVSTGNWEQKSPNEICTQGSDDEAQTCYAEMINEDGVWISTDPDDGEVSTILRVDTETGM